MISYSEAKKIISDSISSLLPIRISLTDAVGLMLAEDEIARIDSPAFNQSSMDGYALALHHAPEKKIFTISGEIAAGQQPASRLHFDDAIRIFTGAAVPEGYDTVVMQEKTRIENGELVITDMQLKPGKNVRIQGEEIKAGMVAQRRGSMLSPAACGFLAGLGIVEVTVYPKPRIALIITGSELQKPGQTLHFGQVYESNSVALKAALQQQHLEASEIIWVKDDADEITAALRDALSRNDVILFTGGVSVGKYDFVTEATKNNGVKTCFHKIKQKPGKPIYFGTQNSKLIFGLPGNPASVLTCFYVYVLPVLKQISQLEMTSGWISVPLHGPVKKEPGLTHFLRGYYDGKVAKVVEGQESFKMISFAAANCLIRIDEEQGDCPAGMLVDLFLLP